jgi:hypothetical protein
MKKQRLARKPIPEGHLTWKGSQTKPTDIAINETRMFKRPSRKQQTRRLLSAFAGVKGSWEETRRTSHLKRPQAKPTDMTMRWDSNPARPAKGKSTFLSMTKKDRGW